VEYTASNKAPWVVALWHSTVIDALNL